MFGRDALLAGLDDACREAHAGRGRLLLVTGEAGIGKSLLAQVASQRAARAGLEVVTGYAVDDPGSPLLWPWLRVARQVPAVQDVLTRDAAPAVDDAEARFGLCEAVATALIEAAESSPLLVLLEDLHWADSLSVAVLRHVALDLDHARVMVLATARDDAGTPLARVVPDLLRSATTVTIPLAGLDVPAVTAWLSSDERTSAWLPRAVQLVRRTDGNPFYIRRIVAEAPPPDDRGVDEIVMERDGLRGILVAPQLALPDDARRTVTVAALLAERLSPTLLAAATGRTVPEITEHVSAATRSGLLQHGPTGLSFVHALVRDAVVAQTSASERAQGHAAIARAMHASHDDRLIGPAAAHWDQAEGHEASAQCRDTARAAAAMAASARAHEEAVHFARMSLRHARALGAGDEDLAGRLVELAGFEWAADLVHEALSSCAEAVDLAEASGRADLMVQAALVPQGVGSVDVARRRDRLCRRALDRVPADDLTARARLLGLLAVDAAEEAVDDSADRLSAAALEIAKTSGSVIAELDAVAARHFVLSYPQAVEERTGLAARAVLLGRAAPTAMGALYGHLWQADIALQVGDLGALDDAVTEIERVSAQRSSSVGRWHVHRLLALRAAMLGRFEEARAQGREGRRLAERIGDLSMLGMHLALQVHLGHLRGAPEEIPDDALELFSQALSIPLVQAAACTTLALKGRVEEARAAFESVRTVPDRMPVGPRWAGTVGQVGLAAVLLGDAEVAGRCYRLFAPIAGWCGGDGGGAPASHASNEYGVGLMAQASGDLATAVAHYERAVEVDIRLGARPYVGLARLGWAECLTGQQPDGASPASRDLAVAAAAEFRRLDMPGPLARAQRLLASLERAQSNRHGLTPRELEIAGLVARALTNQQVADQLVVSVRTVESHVRAALGKLHLTTRTELALWVREQDPPLRP
jgi:DNA-binding CsgD family transcriptional regulator